MSHLTNFKILLLFFKKIKLVTLDMLYYTVETELLSL